MIGAACPATPTEEAPHRTSGASLPDRGTLLGLLPSVNSAESDMRWVAMTYAELGWHVFPLEPGGKKPLPGSRGFKDATSDLDVVYDTFGPRSTYNVGIATGASGLLVVDIDVDKGGKDTMRALLDDKVLTPTLLARTGSGGWHLVYRQASPAAMLGNSAGRLGPGVDTRGDGGYIVAPPSRHPCGDLYQWSRVVLDGDDLPLVPTELAARLTGADEPPVPVGPLPPLLVDRGKRVRGLVDTVANAPTGQRNQVLNWAAFTMRDCITSQEITTEKALDALVRAALVAGLPEHEARATVRSGLGVRA